jgi:uncharacterized RDD family membrane protein YckC
VTYPSAWRRLAGWVIELIVVAVLLAAGLIVGATISNGSLFVGFIVALTAMWLYFAGLESSLAQTTLTGRLLGTRVTDLDGRRITFSRATARHFAMYLSALTPFYAGYLMALWTKRRQTLHDWIARTVVVKSD